MQTGAPDHPDPVVTGSQHRVATGAHDQANEKSAGRDVPDSTSLKKYKRARTAALGIIIFLTAFGVRVLTWHDTRLEVGKVQTVVTVNYKHVARLLLEGGISSFLSPSSPLADPNTLGHPPGYSVLLSLIFAAFGESDTGVQFFQIFCDALAAVIIFLLACELMPRGVGVVAGLLVAFAPQFAWNSVLLLPDTLAVLPLLLAVYLIVRAYKRPRLALLLAAGALVGFSCWLRANAMLIAPFLVVLIPLLFERGKRLRYAAALVGGALLVIAPLTIRNAVVFGHFIPISLGAGQTLIEGIADYDRDGRFGLPATDLGVTKMEADEYGRPDYYGKLFNPDGVKRERLRTVRAFAVIRANPVWFVGVMVRRAASMLRLERARTVAAETPVSHSLDLPDDASPFWSSSPAEFLATSNVRSPLAKTSIAADGLSLLVEGDDSKYDAQLVSATFSLRRDTDYVFEFPIKIKQGRMILKVMSTQRDKLYGSVVIEPHEGKTPDEQPVMTARIPFVNGAEDLVQLVFENGASTPVRPVVEVGRVELFELGEASHTWTRLPRALVRAVQKLFITAVILPLVIIGILLLARSRQWTTLAILLVVPAYYFCVQSAVHTEYRYVLALHYFLFALAAVTIYRAGAALFGRLRRLSVTRGRTAA